MSADASTIELRYAISEDAAIDWFAATLALCAIMTGA